MTDNNPRPFNVYLASEATASLDSFEGIPEIAPEATSDRLQLKYGWQQKLHGSLDSFSDIAPGLLLAGGVALIATYLAKWVGTSVMYQLACLTAALAAIRLGTSFLQIRNLGLRPLAIGLAAANLVGAASIGLIHLFLK
jgi:hypothetical protein